MRSRTLRAAVSSVGGSSQDREDSNLQAEVKFMTLREGLIMVHGNQVMIISFMSRLCGQ